MNGFASAVNHTTTDQLAGDQIEQDEWRDALASLVANAGPARARQILDVLAREGGAPHIDWKPRHGTPYINSISVEQQPAFPGDLATEERLASLVRWNALAMVVRANQAYGELGGHIASYASAADLFEVGFNHFFHARHEGFGGDLVFYQPHSAPGIYARAFLEGRLSEQDLAHYRQEIGGAKVGASVFEHTHGHRPGIIVGKVRRPGEQGPQRQHQHGAGQGIDEQPGQDVIQPTMQTAPEG